MKSKLVDPIVRPIPPQPATSNMLTAVDQESRPILNTISSRRSSLSHQSLLHLLIVERSTNKPHYIGVAPQSSRQLEVALRPPSKPKSLALQKVLIRDAILAIRVRTHETIIVFDDGGPTIEQT